MKINTLCGMLLILFAGEIAAVDGKLVVNGFEIPTRWFANYSRQHNMSNDACDPEVNDDLLIEQMVSLVLPVQEAESRGLTLSPKTVEYIESWFEKADDFPDDTDPDFNAKGEAIYLQSRRHKYTELLAKKYDEDDFIAEYKDQLEKKNPNIVNRQILKVQEFDFSSRSDAEKVQSLYVAGGDYLAAAKLLLDEYDYESGLRSSEEWTAPSLPKNQPDGSPEFKVGDNYVSKTRFWWKLHVVVASQIIPVVGFDEKLLSGWSSTKDDIKWELRDAAHDEVLTELRSKAIVTLDGTVIPKPVNYEKMLTRGDKRINLTAYLCGIF